MHSLTYRADIDGLRAIAVGAVVLYHFGVALPGGFTGVDVFFVISGYLIGGLLWAERAATGRIRIGAFWLRRFRRLAPAFFAMTLVTSLVAWALLLPFELREYGKSLIAASVYLANVLFYDQAGYFDAASEDKPLLHTWSLAVEEQFYLFLPLLVLALARRPRALLWALGAIWAASLTACLWVMPRDPQAAFYLFPFRAWELLSGVLLAIWMRARPRSGPAWAGWAGLALVGVGFVSISAQSAFPGPWALLPVLGTMGLLWAGEGLGSGYGIGVGQLLRLAPMVFLGRISYALYLWHWPVLTLSLQLRGAYAGWWEAGLWMCLSVLLAWLSWALVEQPVRRGRLRSPQALLGFVIVASGAAMTFGSLAYLKNGLPGRFGPEAQVHIAASEDFLQDFSRCTIPDAGHLAGIETCALGPEGPPRVLVWGDSHLRAMFEGLQLAAAETPTLSIWRAGCPPLFGIAKSENSASPSEDAACATANAKIGAALSELPSLERVLLIGRWAYYTEGQGIGFDAENRIALNHPATGTNGLPALEAALAQTLPALRAEVGPVFVLTQPPEQPAYDSRLAAREAARAGWPLAADPVTATQVDRETLAPRTAAARALWSGAEVTRIDPWPALCDAEACFAIHDGTGQYFDTNHLTNRAARRLAPLLAPAFVGLE